MKPGMLKLKLYALLLLTAAAYAEGGFYVGIGAGYTGVSNTPQSGLQFNNGATSTQSGGAPTGNLIFGYDFNRIVGIEANYQVFLNAQLDSYSASQQLLGGSVLVHLPFSIINQHLAGFSAFARGGVDYTAMTFYNVQPTCTSCVNPPSQVAGYAPLLGAGLEYGGQNIGYRLEWYYSGSVMSAYQGVNQVNTTSNSYLISILYHF